jgi:WD40 repeat protein
MDVQHPSRARLQEALAEGGLDAVLEQHLAGCLECRSALEALREDERLLAELRDLSGAENPGDSLLEDVPDGYRVVRQIGRGGQGIVVEAIELESGRHVALKTLVAGDLAGERERLRFEREIALATQLEHRNIVRLLDSGTTGRGRRYLVLEHIDGVDVEEHAIRLRNQLGPTATPRIVALFADVAAAVDHAHRRGIVHRDLKPANVLVDRQGTVKVLDFGLARAFEVTPGTSLTHSGQFLGSLPWAAPEQVGGGPSRSIDARTDVYALGLLLYALLTGEHACTRHESVAGMVHSILHEEPRAPSRAAPAAGISRDLDAIVLKALEKDPRRRYSSATQLLRDCRALLEGRPVSAVSSAGWRALRRGVRRHPLLSGTLGLMVVGGLGLSAASEVRAARAARALVRSDIERCRLEARLGEVDKARSTLRALHSAGADPLATRWALRELLFREPVVHVWPGTGVPLADLVPRGQQGIALVAAGTARIELRALPHLSVERTLEVSGEAEVVALAASPDGDRIAALGGSGRLHLLPANGGSGETLDPGVEQTCLVWDARGELVTGARDGVLRRWDGAHSGTVLARMGEPVTDLALGPHGRVVAALLARGDGFRVIVSERESRATLMNLELGMRMRGLIFCPDGDHLLIQGGNAIAVHRTADGAQVANLSADLTVRPQAAFDPRSGLLTTTGGFRHHLITWDHASGARQGFLGSGPEPAIDLVYGPKGRFLIMWDAGGGLCVREPGRESFSEVLDDQLPAEVDTVHVLAFRPDGAEIALGGGGGTVVCLDVLARLPTAQIRWGEEVMAGLVHVSAGAGRILAGSHDGSVVAWNPGESVVDVIHDHRGVPDAGLAVTPDGRLLASIGDRGQIRFWDLRLDEPRETIVAPDSGRHSTLAWSTDGRGLVVARRDGRLAWIDPDRGSYRCTEEGHAGPTRSLALAPDGSWTISGGSDWNLFVWRFGDARPRQRLTGHGADVFALALSPDGRVLASADRQGIVRVWEVDTWRTLAEVPVADRPIFTLVFAPDGGALWAGGEDRLLRCWDLRATDREIDDPEVR